MQARGGPVRILRGGLHSAAFTLVSLCVGACSQDLARTEPGPQKPDTGQWQFERRNDPVSGLEVVTAWLSISRFHILSGNFYEGEVELMCFRTRPVIRLRFNMRIGSGRTAALAYRFDENPGRFAKAKFFAREKLIVIDDKKEVSEFVDQLQSAQNLLLRVTRLRAGTFTAKFPVHGASHAIEVAFAECPVTEKSKPRTSEIFRPRFSAS